MTEDDLEQACVEWFKELGYSYHKGEAISPGGEHQDRDSYRDAILANRLDVALARLNPDLDAAALDTAASRLTKYSGTSLIESNKELYSWLRDGIPVETKIDGHKRVVYAQVFHWDDVSMNDWLVVNQFTVKGKKTDRPDMVVFVNGIPLAVIELKNPADEDADVWAAYRQIQNYKKEIPQLFEPNLLCLISDGAVARVGSVTAEAERFMPWRIAEGIDDPEKHLELETVVRGVFDRNLFLKYFRHFVAYQIGGAGTFKIIAGYHQFHGILKAVDSAIEATTVKKDGRGGVMWFTQGSGKSLLALFYVGMLREVPELENPTFVIVTDRNDLDGQLYETFAGCRSVIRTEPKQADDRLELRNLLSKQVAGGVFFTTIQKFAPEKPGDQVESLCDRHNVIVICDEAHRTQYGFNAKVDSKTGKIKYGLAKYMRDALPHATYLGLTGTPISIDDRDTQAVFGGYVDIYDVLSSQQDGTTVPIHYESRIIELKFNQDEIKELDDELEELTESEDKETRQKAISRLSRLESIAMADGRMQTLAKDLLQHWDKRLETIDGKGMVVAISRNAAAVLYDEIIKLRPDWHSDDLTKGKIKVVMTSRSSDKGILRQHHTNKQQKKLLEKRLKDPNDELRIVIVRDMWLTGFDVPCLHTLYLDKPMQGHGLMQAIARVNRVWKDKPGGLVVDYIGIGEELKKAIAQYTQVRGKNRGKPIEFVEGALTILKDTVDVIRTMFHGFDYSSFSDSPQEALRLLPLAMDHICKFDPEDDGHGRNRGIKRYLDQVARLTKAQALAGTHTEALFYREEIAFFQAVRAALAKYAKADKDMNKVEREAAMRQLVAKGVLVEGVTDLYKTLGLERPDISVLDEEFLAQVAKLPTKSLAAELLQRLVKDEIKSRGKKNKTQEAKFSKKLAEAITKYRNRALTTKQVIEELLNIAKEIKADTPPSDMSEDEFAFFEALAENESAVRELGDPILKALALELTEKLRKSATIDWSKREAARARMRMMVKVLLTKYRYPPDKQPEAVTKVIEQAELFADEWALDAAC